MIVEKSRMTGSQIEAAAAQEATPAQLPMLAKMSKMGWQVTTLLRPKLGGWHKTRIGLASATGAKGWLEPDGSFTRHA